MRQRKNYIKALIILAFASLPNFATNTIYDPINTENCYNEGLRDLTNISKKELFKHIAFKESSNQYNVANQLNMLGKYQASKSALIDFGYSEETIDSIYTTIYTDTLETGKVFYYFDTSIFTPAEQERFIRWYMKKIEHTYLKDVINEFVGQEIQGVYITKAGILYASMLGFGHVINFFTSKGIVDFNDANGTSIKERLKEFESIELQS